MIQFSKGNGWKIWRRINIVVVTASRTYGQTVDNVKDIAHQYGYRVIRFTSLYMYEPVNVIDWMDLKEFSVYTIIYLNQKSI